MWLLALHKLVDMGRSHGAGMIGNPCGDLAVTVWTAVRGMHRLDQVGKLVSKGSFGLLGFGHSRLLRPSIVLTLASDILTSRVQVLTACWHSAYICDTLR